MKCTMIRIIDGGTPEVSQVEGEPGQMQESIKRECFNDSRRLRTTQQFHPVFEENPSEWDISLNWEDGTTDRMVLSFPDADAEPFPEDEAEWCELESAIPLFPSHAHPLNYTTTMRFCVNGVGPHDAEHEVSDFVTHQMQNLGSGVLGELTSIGMDVIVKVKHPSGAKFTIQAVVVDRMKALQFLGDNSDGNLLNDILNQITKDDDDD